MLESINNQSMLKVGTILHGTYRIDSYLSSGGFGNTYVATNIEFEERVAIKEFFMKGVTQRDDNQTTVSVSNTENHNSFLEQKEKFKKEARRIRQLKNEHIISVHDLFEENGTAYYVMDYVDGENLAERLKRTGKPMMEQEVRGILPQILDALKSVHNAGIWHLDLKPANIMLDKSGKVKLIDFGASKQLNMHKGGATTSTAISYTNGFAPREQMEQNYDKFGPWTDIYALGATLYNILTNKRPPLPTDIDDDASEDKHVALPFPEGVDELKFLVLQMMNTNRLQRPQSIDAIIGSEKSKIKKSQQNPQQKSISPTSSVYDDEVTILQINKDEEIVEPNPELKPEPKDAHHTTSQATHDFFSKENGKVIIDYTMPIYNKAWISILSFSVLCCIPVMIAPALLYSQRNDEPLSTSFESSTLFVLTILSSLLFPVLTSILYAILSKGIWKLNKDISLLLIICSFLVLAHFGHHFFVSNEILNWTLFFGIDFCGLLCGLYIISRCGGNIVRLGKIFIAYYSINAFLNIFAVSGIYHDFDLTTYTLYESAVWCFDLLWIYGMWWMLTRNPNEIKE